MLREQQWKTVKQENRIEKISTWLDSKYNKYRGILRPLGFIFQIALQIYNK